MNKRSLLRDVGVGLILGAVLTGASYAVAFSAGWTDEVNWIEAFAVFTSYTCTYLCVRQSRLNYPFGMLSTIAYCVFFWQLGLYSSMALNAYLPFALLYGWLRWREDTRTLPVTHLAFDWWLAGYAAAVGLIFAGVIWVSSAFGAMLPVPDAIILIGSILAQLLLDNKKIETWIVWVVVNVVAILVYFQAGAYIAAFQFVFFLLNAFWGWAEWKRSIRPLAIYRNVR